MEEAPFRLGREKEVGRGEGGERERDDVLFGIESAGGQGARRNLF